MYGYAALNVIYILFNPLTLHKRRESDVSRLPVCLDIMHPE